MQNSNVTARVAGAVDTSTGDHSGCRVYLSACDIEPVRRFSLGGTAVAEESHRSSVLTNRHTEHSVSRSIYGGTPNEENNRP